MTNPNLDSARFEALIEEFKQFPATKRAVDELLPVAGHIRKLHEEGYTYIQLWRLTKEAGFVLSYTTFLRAMSQIEDDTVQPAALMRRRRRPTSARPVIPLVPESVSIASPAPARPASTRTAPAEAVPLDERQALMGRSVLDLRKERQGRKSSS